ncbi:MAG TPA: porin [Caldimonas sp.]|nr:porin [Caldimonas sp.]
MRSICARALVAVALCAAGAAGAQTAVLYGLLDASGTRIKPVGGDDYVLRLTNGNMQTSFIGVRGSEDLGGGLRGVFRLESYLRVDVGGAGRDIGDAFWAREASAGLSGSFGTTVLGRTPTPLWLATTSFNPFGESLGFSPTVRQYWGGAMLGDTRWNNSIWYTNNARDPLRVVFSANADETTPAGSNGHNLGLSIAYITGPFAATIVAERVRNSAEPVPAGFERQTVWHAGATYDFQFIRVYGQAGRIKTEAAEDSTTTSYQLGVAVPFGTSLVLVAYGHQHVSAPTKSTTGSIGSIGYDYFLSKRTDIYVAATYEKLSSVSSGNSIAGGVRVKF